MHPVLFTIGSVKVFSYGFMIALGLFISFSIVRKRGRYKDFLPEQLIDLMILTTIIGLIGARILYVARFSDQYYDNMMAIFKVWEGGLILYGGTLTALLFLFLKARATKRPFFMFTDALVPYFVLIQGFGRIGCFLNGCCGGRETTSCLSVVMPGTHYAVHPTQIYSSVLCFSIAYILFKFNKDHNRIGLTTVLYFMLYPVGRFFIEFLRINPRIFFDLFTHAQLISAILFIIAMCVFVSKQYWKSDEQ